MAEEVTSDKIELSQQQTRVWILVGVVSFLVLLVQGFFTLVITSASTEMRETNRNLTQVATTMQVLQAHQNYMQKDINDLKAADKEEEKLHRLQETRFGSVEQRLALHDQWISAHNN
jgi:predicted PurR-regulated permease PerM